MAECVACGSEDAVSTLTLMCGECEDALTGHPVQGEVLDQELDLDIARMEGEGGCNA